ncbi:MAG: hypothetical protein M1136_11975 [Chloroflexi bacterium]|nr:hypothetical protein [Chloroflexota bacterium]
MSDEKRGQDSQESGHRRNADPEPVLTWIKASYHLHTFAYRDPRCAFPTAMGLPVISPTAVLLGVASTLFCLGKADEAKRFLEDIHKCQVVIDSPDGVIFFRAFHQLRRYETDKYDKSNPRLGFTDINQGVREYGIPEGLMTIFIGVPNTLTDNVRLALRNRDHLGTHDSLCALVGDVEICSEPTDVLYRPIEAAPFKMPAVGEKVTAVTLSRFKSNPIRPTVGAHWWMAGGDDTQLIAYMIPGEFVGTSHGKIYRKR